MRVLLVEDEVLLASALQQVLTEQNYIVDIAHDGETGLDLALADCYDVLVLDVMLPKLTGFEIVTHVREMDIHVPILLLTAKDAVDDRVHGLDIGADDYLVKPFANKELLARVKALTRRNNGMQEVEILTVGDFTMNVPNRQVTRSNEVLNLTSKEFALLEVMMRNPGKVLSKEVLLDRVWGPEANIVGNAVENYVYFLRRKIENPGTRSYIETVRGVGYVFQTPS